MEGSIDTAQSTQLLSTIRQESNVQLEVPLKGIEQGNDVQGEFHRKRYPLV